MNLKDINNIASELFSALRDQTQIKPLTVSYPEININDAYQISKTFLSFREKEGEVIVGKKNWCN